MQRGGRGRGRGREDNSPSKRNILLDQNHNFSHSELLSSSKVHDSNVSNDNIDNDNNKWTRESAGSSTSSPTSSSQASGAGSSLTFEGSAAAAAASVNVDRDGNLFQEKIRLLKESMQRQRATLEKKQKEKESRTLMNTKHQSPKSKIQITSSTDRRGEEKSGLGTRLNRRKKDMKTSEMYFSIPPPRTEHKGVVEKGTLDPMNVKNTPKKRKEDCGTLEKERNLTSSPVLEVVVVVEEEDSPLHVVQEREPTTKENISVAAEAGGGRVLTSLQTKDSGTVSSSCNADKDKDDDDDKQKDQEEKKDNEMKRNEKQGSNSKSTVTAATATTTTTTTTTTNTTTTTKSAKRIQKPGTQNVTSQSHHSTNKLHDATTQTNLIRSRIVLPKRTAEIRTLRAPSECSLNSLNSNNNNNSNNKKNDVRLSDRSRYNRLTGLDGSIPSFNTETKRAYRGFNLADACGNENDDPNKPEPRKKGSKTTGLKEEEDIEQLLNYSTDTVLDVENHLMSSENVNEGTMRVVRRRNSTPSCLSDKQGSIRYKTSSSCGSSSSINRKSCKDDDGDDKESDVLDERSHSPNPVGPWEEKAIDPRIYVPSRSHSRSPSNTHDKLQSTSKLEGISFAHQRYSLIRLIRLIDEELHRLESVPWSRSLRQRGGSYKLNTERFKLIRARKHYEAELQRLLKTVVHFSGSAQPSTPPPLPLSSISTSSPQRERSTSKPRHGPSVYEALLRENYHNNQQRRQGQGKSDMIKGKTHSGTVVNKGDTVSKRTIKVGGNNEMNNAITLPPRSTTHMKSRPDSHTMERSNRSKSLTDNRNLLREGGSELRRSRSSISLDANRMAALYRRSASSSRRGETPRRDLTMMGVSPTEDISHGMDRNAPLYWRLAREQRSTQRRSETPCEMNKYPSNCTSTPIPAHERSGIVSHNTSETELCSDIPADRYYCAEYDEEEDVMRDEWRNSTRRRDTVSSAARGRSRSALKKQEASIIMERPSSTVQSREIQQEQQGKEKKRLLSSQALHPQFPTHRGGVRLTGVMGTLGKERNVQAGLCYQLRAPTLQTTPENSEVKDLYFRPESISRIGGSETTTVLPQPLSNEEQLTAYLKMEERQRRQQGTGGHVNYAPPLSHLSLKEERLKQSDNSLFVHHSSASIDTFVATGPPTSSSSSLLLPPPTSTANKDSTAEQFHSKNEFLTRKRDEVIWTSPLCSQTSPPILESTPPPSPKKPQKTTTTHQSGHRSHHREGDNNNNNNNNNNNYYYYYYYYYYNNNNNTDKRSPSMVVYRDPSEPWRLNGEEGYTTEDRTPPSKQQEQQKRRREQEQEKTDNSPHFSEVRVSPLTEYSGGEGSPMTEFRRRKPNKSMEREPDFRKVMTRYNRRSLSNSRSPPQQERETKYMRERSTGTVPSIFFTDKIQKRQLGDDRTNEILHPHIPSPMKLTPKQIVGGGRGNTLRQVIGHDEKTTCPSKVSNKHDETNNGLSSTELLLSRIKQIRAQMN
ncbi:uncharacterized protein TM35_000271690 [Trypanosoma theileri]|uniref:Uncharacterized protein n=1 Tax=Trypanosoma theileri TaxID=67003 RepID=A0A1X0NQY0_9TRYP|nr:uncharacterized protein TM35_000271690 [Trypanosoma theileri]ORC86579.1 hypothetical protein TM35_000271690 [Trypanosoma theileri]